MMTEIFLQANLHSSAHTRLFSFGVIFVLQLMIVLTNIVNRSMYIEVRRFKLWKAISAFLVVVVIRLLDY